MAEDRTNDPSIGDLDDQPRGVRENKRIFQDDLVVDDTVVDPVMVEAQDENDDPVAILGIPANELKEELDKRAFDDADEPLANTPEEDFYEGTSDDLYSEQVDATDQASDRVEADDEATNGSIL